MRGYTLKLFPRTANEHELRCYDDARGPDAPPVA